MNPNLHPDDRADYEDARFHAERERSRAERAERAETALAPFHYDETDVYERPSEHRCCSWSRTSNGREHSLGCWG